MITLLSALIDDKNRQVYTVAPDVSVAIAVQEMNQHNIGALLVVEDDELVGIFTERDVLVRVVAARLDPTITAVRQVMTAHPVCVSPEMSLDEAMLLVTEKRFRHLPVIHNGVLYGLISSGDLTRWLVRDQGHRISDLSAYIMDVPAH